MTSPGEIAASAVRDELYARAAFARLIALPAARFRAEVEGDPMAQTEFMAAQIVDHYEKNFAQIPQEVAIELLLIARAAALRGQPHVRTRVEKNLGTAFRTTGRYAEAELALEIGGDWALQTLNPGLHHGTLQYARMSLLWAAGCAEEAAVVGEAAVATFEENGALDRAYMVRLCDAWTKILNGEYVVALAAYEDAARRAQELNSDLCLAGAYENIGHCYRGLTEFRSARRYFARSGRVYRRLGALLLEARALRCMARMSIRLNRETGIREMDAAKEAFLQAGAAGEVCRSTVAIMEELLFCDPSTDFTSYCRDLAQEALTLGVLQYVETAIDRLHEAAAGHRISEQLLSDTWMAFGPAPSHPGISALVTVSN